jgi:hypothetical protein
MLTISSKYSFRISESSSGSMRSAMTLKSSMSEKKMVSRRRSVQGAVVAGSDLIGHLDRDEAADELVGAGKLVGGQRELVLAFPPFRDDE